MYFKKNLAFLYIFFVIVNIGYASASEDFKYKKRGDRWEGIDKSKEVSGEPIKLLSILTKSKEYNELKTTPEKLKIGFYLSEEQANQVVTSKNNNVSITVRALNGEHYYRMDKIEPLKAWRIGLNIFEWATKDVIKPMNIKVNDLGAVVHIIHKKEIRSREEPVVPVIIGSSLSDFDMVINSYSLTLETERDAELTYKVFQEKENKNIIEGETIEYGEEPFTIEVDLSKEEGGCYNLLIEGEFFGDHDTFKKTIKFYHKGNKKNK